MTATPNPVAEEPLPLPTVKVIHDNIINVVNMLSALKADVATKDDLATVATKDDLAAVNERLDTLTSGLIAAVDAIKSIGGWIQDAEGRIADMSERLARVEGRLDDMSTTVKAIYEHLAQPMRDEIDEHLGRDSDG